MHKSSVRFGSANKNRRFGSVRVRQTKIGGSVRFGFGKKFLVRLFPNTNITHFLNTIIVSLSISDPIKYGKTIDRAIIIRRCASSLPCHN